MHEALAVSLSKHQEREFRREWRRWVHEDCRFFGRPGSGIFGDEAYPMPFGADRGISTPLRLETAAAERSDYEYIWQNRGGSKIWKRKKVTTVASPSASTASSAASVVTATPPGSVHTSYTILGSNISNSRSPPPDLFRDHNEWFW